MVLLTQVLGYAKKSQRKFLQKGLIDSLRIHVKGGTGGSGLPQYGGLGGSGGNIYIVSHNEKTLENVLSKHKTKRLSAEPGSPSTARGIIGAPGADMNIEVPLGITVYNEFGAKLGEVNKEGEKLLVAKGGLGGSKETGFCGLKGEAQTIMLDLKLIADVGLVGFPNAGKSTFLRAVSKATPKVANYPFTTIRPQIGIVNYKDYRQITVADLPGLIEGAHKNVGMGHKFLKHLERTKLLLFIIDVGGFQISKMHNYRSCLETMVLLNKEIELFKPDLLRRPAMLIINKMDTEGANEAYKEIEPKLKNLSEYIAECDESIRPEKAVKFDSILTASLMLKKNNEIETIKETLRNIIDKYEEQKHFAEYDEEVEYQLFEKLKRQSERYSPVLV